MNLDNLIKYEFNPEVPIPTFLLSRNQLKLPEVVDDTVVAMFKRYSFVDTSDRVWQGLFIQNIVQPGSRNLNGNTDKKEVLFIFFCQGHVNEYTGIFDAPVVFQPPYHIILTRESYLLRNTGIYAVPFDYDVDRKAMYSMGDDMVAYLQELDTVKIIHQVEKWINHTLPLFKYYSTYKQTKVQITAEDYNRDFKRARYVDLRLFKLLGLPSDSGGITRIKDSGDLAKLKYEVPQGTDEKPRPYQLNYDSYNPEEIAPIRQRKELDRMFQIMATGVPTEESIIRPYGTHIRPVYGTELTYTLIEPDEEEEMTIATHGVYEKPIRVLSCHISPN